MNTMTPNTVDGLKTFAVETFKFEIDAFVKDLQALTHEQLSKSWGAGARTGYDIAFEVGVVNERVAKRCRGEDPGPMPWEFGKEWLKAPENFQNVDAMVKHLETTGAELLDAAGSDLEREIRTPEKAMPAYQLVIQMALHTAYHGAQLNFIQELNGDMAVHWM